MAPRYVLLAAVLLASPTMAFAQEEEAAPREAVPRATRPQGDNPRTGTAVRRTAPAGNPAPEAGTPRAENRGGTSDRGAVDRGTDRGVERRRDNRGGTTVIVPDRSRTVIVRPNVYGGYYDPRRAYPYGYGAFGLGYFYYDPYRWGGGPSYPGYGYGGGYYSNRPYSSFDIGELRLDVSPRHAQVFVDGYYAGVVDDFDGAFQALKLTSGAYRIDISAPGYETLTFDVRIDPGRDVRYRGDLRRY